MKEIKEENYTLILGDNLQSMKTMEDNSIDSVVTDPPYGLTSIVKRFGKSNSKDAQYGTDGVYKRSSKGFMGKEWDADVPSVEFGKKFIEYLNLGVIFYPLVVQEPIIEWQRQLRMRGLKLEISYNGFTVKDSRNLITLVRLLIKFKEINELI